MNIPPDLTEAIAERYVLICHERTERGVRVRADSTAARFLDCLVKDGKWTRGPREDRNMVEYRRPR